MLGDLDELRRRLGDYAELIRADDSELFFTLITKRIEEHDGDVGAGITAAAREIAAEHPAVLAQHDPDDARPTLGASLPRDERAVDPGALARRIRARRGFDERSASGIMRVQSGALSVLPATVIASERMDASDGWRLLESGELSTSTPTCT